MKKNNENKYKIISALIGLAGIIIGTFGTWYVNNYLTENDPAQAKVQQYEGVYIFLRSRPLHQNYTSVGIVKTNTLSRALESTQGKKKFGEILESIGESLVNDVKFDSRLEEIVQRAKEQYPQMNGMIFSNNLTECEVISFIPNSSN